MTEGQVIHLGPRGFLRDLKPGDKVLRLLSSAAIPMPVVIDKIEGDLIYAVGGWTFDRETGVEEDPELGFGIESGIVASWLERKMSDDEKL